MQSIIGLAIVMVIVVAVFSPLLDNKGRRTIRVAARSVMSDREVKFWQLLLPAAAPFHVAPQVAMRALLRVASGMDKRGWRSSRNAFAQKIVDFVLLDDDGTVRLLIELDDRTHNAAADAKRDKMTAQAGYRTLRVNGVTARDFRLLKAAIDDALGIAPSWSPPEFNPAIAPRRARSTSARPSTPPA